MVDGGEGALVLVHGGGHDARCWELVAKAIGERSDVRVLAVDLPGRGTRPGSLRGLTLAACVDAVVEQIRAAQLGRVVLVGHSMAGLIVPGVADVLGEQVAHVVLIAANVAPPGRPVLDTLPLASRIGGRTASRWPRPYRLPKAMARAMFCNGMTPEQTRFITDRLVPEAGWLVRERVPGPQCRPPTTWVLTERDRVVSPALQRATIATLGTVVDVVELDAPHDVMASHPGELAEVLLAIGSHSPNPRGWREAVEADATFAVFDQQDSGCISVGIETAEGRRFVKTATTPASRASLDRAMAFHRTVQHPAIVAPIAEVDTPTERRLVSEWRDGIVLNHATVAGSNRAGLDRFHQLPRAEVLEAIDVVLDAHVAIAGAGLVAVDLYDGCFLYDFDDRRMQLIDLDEYRPGPFVVEGDRMPGSTRYMAPEELTSGATIDERTTVFNLGRTISELLGASPLEPDQRAVVERATCADPADRYPGVADLVAAWRVATRDIS